MPSASFVDGHHRDWLLHAGQGEALKDALSDLPSACRGDRTSPSRQLGLPHGEEQVAAAQGLQFQAIRNIEKDFIGSRFAFVRRAHYPATQHHDLRPGLRRMDPGEDYPASAVPTQSRS